MRVYSRRPLIERACEQCGAPVLVRAKVIERGHGRFCSHRCSSRYHGNRHRLSAETRYWQNVIRAGDDECWLWTGLLVRGYGQMSVDGRMVYAHRLGYELAHGPIPDGLFVLHNCPGGDNPACSNPRHLWLGTQADNVRDREAKGRGHRGEAINTAKLTEAQVREIRRRYDAGDHRCRHMAREFGVWPSVIGAIGRRQAWAHVADPSPALPDAPSITMQQLSIDLFPI